MRGALVEVLEGGQARCSTSVAVKDHPRLDIPRRGHVLTTVAEKYGEPIREAVSILSDSLAKKDCSQVRKSLELPLRWQPAPDMVRTDSEMAAWTIASIWIVGIASRALPLSAGLEEAEQWFFDGEESAQVTNLLSKRAINSAEVALQTDVDAGVFYELLPYILDPHGPGSRLSVRRDPNTHAARLRKRMEGVFYTPADVAEFMVDSCLSSMNEEKSPTVFDPACGTGVFLRAALKALLERNPEETAFSLASQCLFGTDIDPWPLDASAFVLLADILMNEPILHKSPAELWRRLRLNLVCIDTLRIDGADVAEETDHRIPIFKLFPQLEDNPAVVVGNPPYTDLGDRTDISDLAKIFRTLAVKPRANAEIYLTFIEQMTRLASKELCACALVLPLSIACNVGSQFMAARKLIQETEGHWRFAFFDREPHALFGEDVKTRNAILLWSRNSAESRTVLASGPLLKWRGDSRATMFNSIRFTEFDGDIRTGIPKIDGEGQSAALHALTARWSCLEQSVQRIEKLNLAEVPNSDDRTVFVGPTAYNFLNVFLLPPRLEFDEEVSLSEHSLHAIRCASTEDALVVFAILSSHLAYWWWHTHGDGFHVSRVFITRFPFGMESFKGETGERLLESGAALWSAIKRNPIVSLNRGKTSLAYSPNGHDDMRRCSDKALADVVGLKDGFVDELQQFTAHAVTARLRDFAVPLTPKKKEDGYEKPLQPGN